MENKKNPMDTYYEQKEDAEFILDEIITEKITENLWLANKPYKHLK